MRELSGLSNDANAGCFSDRKCNEEDNERERETEREREREREREIWIFRECRPYIMWADGRWPPLSVIYHVRYTP